MTTAASSLPRQTGDVATPCALCGASAFSRLWPSPTGNGPNGHFTVATCSTCGLARTEPQLEEADLAPYYTATYYGGNTQKFTGLFESAVGDRKSVV